MDQMEFEGLPLRETWRRPLYGVRREVPQDHFKQPDYVQGVFEGMQMSPQEHVDALAARFSHLGVTHGEFLKRSTGHGIHLFGAIPDYDKPAVVGLMHWLRKDYDDDPYGGEGEIGLLDVHPAYQRRGMASAIVETGLRIAAEHPEIAGPRNSSSRTPSGLAFSKRFQQERGLPNL